MTTWCQLLW